MKKITVAICVDDRGGIMFNNRRQSRDRVLIKELCESSDKKIYINEYSLPLFKEYSDKVCVCDNPIIYCPDDSICFVEGQSLANYKDIIKKVILYRWNRAYPSDIKLDLYDELSKKSPKETKDFEGSSHEKITKDIYIL